MYCLNNILSREFSTPTVLEQPALARLRYCRISTLYNIGSTALDHNGHPIRHTASEQRITKTLNHFSPIQHVQCGKGVYGSTVRIQQKYSLSTAGLCKGLYVPTTCTEPVLKIMDAGYCLYVHIFMKNIKSLKPFNFKGVLQSKK